MKNKQAMIRCYRNCQKITTDTLVLFIFFYSVLCAVPDRIHADVITDGTVGPAQPLQGPSYLIPDTLGTIAGSNLFHSFTTFSIDSTQSATFTGPDTIANVISRVTGGEASSIDGVLKSEVGQADFFFINPSGVVFGPNAQVDVPAAFHVSTADELQFSDGAVFSASDPDRSSLSVSSPAAFGFLAQQSASIMVEGSQLEFEPGSKVTLSGGDLAIQQHEDQNAKLKIEEGEIHLTAVGSESGSVPISGNPAMTTNGTLVMDHATLWVNGGSGGCILVDSGNFKMHSAGIYGYNDWDESTLGGIELNIGTTFAMENSYVVEESGNITLNAGEILLDNSNIYTGAYSSSTGNAGAIDITPKDRLEMKNDSRISSSTSGMWNSGGVSVTTGEMTIDSSKIYTHAASGSEGVAGDIDIMADGQVTMLNSATIYSDTYSAGNGGDITITAGQVTLSEGTDQDTTLIYSLSGSGSTGNAGAISINAATSVTLENGAQVNSLTSSEGNTGNITIRSESLKIIDDEDAFATGIHNIAQSGSTGQVGSIQIDTSGAVELFRGAQILSETNGGGNAGSILINSSQMTLDGQDADNASHIISRSNRDATGDSGDIIINTSGAVVLENGAKIINHTYSEGNTGNITIQAESLKISMDDESSLSTGISNLTENGSTGQCGSIQIEVNGAIQLYGGVTIYNGTYGKGNAGNLMINAGEMTLTGLDNKTFPRILSESKSWTTGNSGDISIHVDELIQFINSGLIASFTYSEGDAGKIVITAKNLIIDEQGNNSNSGISCEAKQGSQGNGGTIEIYVDDLIKLADGAEIASSTWSTGDAGSIKVNAGELIIDNKDSASETGFELLSLSGSKGTGGNLEINIDGDMTLLNGAFISGSTSGEGDAGTISINVKGLLEILNGDISSSTSAKGDGGSVLVQAGEMIIDAQDTDGQFSGIASQANSNSQGDAGEVQVRVDGLLQIISGGQISSSTYAEGDAGSVNVTAAGLTIDPNGVDGRSTGIASNADSGSKGNAGEVNVTVTGLLEIANGAEISSSTTARGNAGNVNIVADDLRVSGVGSGIYSAAGSGADGYTGNITITADKVDISDGGQINISANQTLSGSDLTSIPASSVFIDTKNLYLNGGAKITAESTGNVPAGGIIIRADRTIVETESSITTSSDEADGGDITVQGKSVFLHGGLITTSVTGDTGSGGDITITGNNGDNTPAEILALQNGFIQANTAAQGASGGDIFIHTNAVLSDAEYDFSVGQEERLTFDLGQRLNVIQAAAPGGEKGTINITAPELDPGSTMANLNTGFSNPVRLSSDPCTAGSDLVENSLVKGGMQGMPQTLDDLSTISFMEDRLDTLIK